MRSLNGGRDTEVRRAHLQTAVGINLLSGATLKSQASVWHVDERRHTIAPPHESIVSLRQRHLGDSLIEVACTMTECLHRAADDVASDTRADSFDDTTSRGGLLYRRARNRMVANFLDDERVVCDTTDNALHIRVGATAISFYSARNGLDSPSVTGSQTKRSVVDESQTMLVLDDRQEIRRLVLMHEASPDGLVRAALGLLESATKWSWRVTLFDRFAADNDAQSDARGQAYDARPEAELPPFKLRHGAERSQSSTS